MLSLDFTISSHKYPLSLTPAIASDRYLQSKEYLKLGRIHTQKGCVVGYTPCDDQEIGLYAYRMIPNREALMKLMRGSISSLMGTWSCTMSSASVKLELLW